jgi:hypothetical protein
VSPSDGFSPQPSDAPLITKVTFPTLTTESSAALINDFGSPSTTIPTPPDDDPLPVNLSPLDIANDEPSLSTTSGKQSTGKKRGRTKAAAPVNRPTKRHKTTADVASREPQAGQQSTCLKSKKENAEAVPETPELGEYASLRLL